MSASHTDSRMPPDRLAAMRRAGLDDASQQPLDRITQLVRTGLRVPVSLISLVDGHSQFFASARGLEEPWATRLETPLSHSFCKHVVNDAAPLVVNDARLEPRVSANLAVSNLNVVAYLGVPLVSPGGDPLGTLCAIDAQPRDWTKEDTAFLTSVADIFTDHLVLRRRTDDLHETTETLSRLRLLSDRSSEAQFIVTESGAIVSVNHTASERMGYSAQELAHLNLTDIQPDSTPETVRDLLASARSLPIEPFEAIHVRRDGTPFPVELSVAVVSFGAEDHLAITARDISERKRRVADLAEREARLRFALDAGGMGAWDWDLREHHVRISDRLATLLALPAGQVELREDEVLELVHPDDREAVVNKVRPAIDDGREFEVECRAVRGDGEVRWMLVRGQIRHDPMRRPVRMLGVTLDVTERRATFDELSLRDERIRALLDSTAEGIYGLDLEGRCTFANEACARLLGFDRPDDLLDRNMHALIHHHRADGTAYPEHECHIYQALRDHQGVHVDDELLFRRDGTPFPAEYWSYPIHRGGERVGAVVTFLDISERIDAQRRVVESEVFLRSSIDALGTHIAILDEKGAITRTNRAWDTFARENGGDPVRTGESVNYIQVCAAAEGDDVATRVRDALIEIVGGTRSYFEIEYPCDAPDRPRWFLLRLSRFETASGPRVVAAHDDITSRKLAEMRLERRSEMLARLNEVNRSLAAELDLEALVNRVTGVTTALCGARFGVFFYSVLDDRGGAQVLSAVAGADRAVLAHLPVPPSIEAFDPTFGTREVIRFDDITREGDYVRDAPFVGMPLDELGVRSYLAAPVITRGGEILGGLFFGHTHRGAFTDEAESLVSSIAAQAAVAIDNARLYRDIKRREEEYRGTFENAAVGMAHVSLDGAVLRANDRFQEITGRAATPAGTLLFPAIVHADDRERAEGRLKAVTQGAGRKSLDEIRYRHERGHDVWVLQTASVVVDDEGQPSYVALIVQDISDRKQAEVHQNLLVRELSHRVKNLLATVASIASQTLRQATDLDEFADAFQGRLAALANVHTLLVQTDWKGASLRSIADRNFAPYAKDREDAVRIEGADLLVSPRAALALSLVLHELTTNAIKYGALSQREGSISLSWQVTDTGAEQRLFVDWSERGGPPVTPPDSVGFGTTLIEKGVEFELDGNASVTYPVKGVECRLDVPWSAITGK